jgi:hypothetical protein
VDVNCKTGDSHSRLVRWARSATGRLVLSAALVGMSGAIAHAACSDPGFSPTLPTLGWGPSAICAGVSAGASIATAVTTVNTAFLTQTSAFISSPTVSSPDQQGGGIWLRGVGGSNTVTSTATSSSPYGTYSADSRSRINFGGVQAGADIGRFNIGSSGYNLTIGLTGGFITAGDTELAGVGSYNFTVPFFGAYAALMKGNFFIDAMVRGDFYQIDATNSLVGLSNSFSGDAITVSSSMGYKFDIGSYFVEPSVGVVWSRLNLNSLNVPGGGPFGVPQGIYSFDPISSVLGRAGVRVGTTFQSGNVAWQPFVTASIWNEFAGDVTSRFSCTVAGDCPLGSLNIDTTRVGTYGQFGLGVTGELSGSGWLGYVRADYRTGDNIEGWDFTGGIRYRFDGEAPRLPLITK